MDYSNFGFFISKTLCFVCVIKFSFTFGPVSLINETIFIIVGILGTSFKMMGNWLN